jgi:hypothetical protein
MKTERKPDLPESELVSKDFQRILDQQPDIGTARIIATWFVDPPNIFDPLSRRKPKPEIVMLLGYVLIMAAVCAAFNFR